MWKKTWDSPWCGSSAVLENTWVVQGAGGPYYEYTMHPQMQTLPWIDKMLIYYQKGSVTFGNHVSSIQELSNERPLKLYPNPACSYLLFDDDRGSSEYEIMDYSGRTIARGRLVDEKLDISQLPHGFYCLKLSSEKGPVSIGKFVKSEF